MPSIYMLGFKEFFSKPMTCRPVPPITYQPIKQQLTTNHRPTDNRPTGPITDQPTTNQ